MTDTELGDIARAGASFTPSHATADEKRARLGVAEGAGDRVAGAVAQ